MAPVYVEDYVRMTAEFTAEEENRLRPFFTNLDRSVFGLKLPQEVAGALFSRYSRSTKSLRRTFLDEFLGDPELGLKDLLGGENPATDDSAALKKARAFYERVLVGYGDDSVAQLGGAHLACENISNVAAKLPNVGMFGVGQAFEYLISKFYSHELSEAKKLGDAMHGELNQLIPSFVKRAQLNDYLVGTTAAAKALAAKAANVSPRDFKE